jgi:HEPN domain-containing protein
MSYDPLDAMRDEMYEEISRELYPEHRAQAIGDFTAERLRSYYVANPQVMRPAVDAIQEGKRLAQSGHSAAAVVFFVTAVEILLKATLLKPVVYGLVHSEGLADIIVEQALGQPGFDRYSNLLAQLFSELAAMDIRAITRKDTKVKLLAECTALQKLRNEIIHQGATCEATRAEHARAVAVAVYELVVHPMLAILGLQVIERGEIQSLGG